MNFFMIIMINGKVGERKEMKNGTLIKSIILDNPLCYNTHSFVIQ